MTKNLLYVWVLMLLGAVSCQKNDLNSPKAPGDQVAEAITLTADEAERLPLFESDCNRSHGDVLAIANGLAEHIAKEERQTKTKSPSRAAVLTDSIVIAFPATKSTAATQIPDQAKIYVVNFGDNAGYTLIAGDKRVTSDILAYSESSHFDVQTDNPGAQLAMEYMQSYMQDEIVRLEAMRGDSVYTALQARYGFGAAHAVGTDGYTPQTKSFQQPTEIDALPGRPGSSPENPYGTKQGSNWQVVQNGIIWYWAPVDQIVDAEQGYRDEILPVVYPLVPSQWGQDWPYNTEVVKYENTTKAGCGPVAMAQIMSYFKKPAGYLWNDYGHSVGSSFIDSRTELLWDNKSEAIRQDVGRLLYTIGTTAGARYDPTSTGLKTELVATGFRKFGYSCAEYSNFNQLQLEENLKFNKTPVYMSGARFGTDNMYHGHAWVVDGCSDYVGYNFRYQDCYYQGENVGFIRAEITPSYNQTKYFHCNWGWNGMDDGWYLAGIFNPPSHGNYNQQLYMITSIRY